MELRKKVEIVLNDKEYLTKENITYAEKVRTLEDKVDRLSDDLSGSKKKNSEY